MYAEDPAFWRAGAISSTLVMLIVLAFLTVDSLATIRPGGTNVPHYTVINKEIRYEFDSEANRYRPVIGVDQPLFGRVYSPEEAEKAMRLGKLVIQSRNCMNCHTFFGNGAYYAPDLTKAWLDPAWQQLWMPMTQAASREEAIATFLMYRRNSLRGAGRCPTFGSRAKKPRRWWRISNGWRRWRPTASRFISATSRPTIR